MQILTFEWSESDRHLFLEAWRLAKHALSPIVVLPPDDAATTPPNVEKTMSDVLDILAKDKLGRGATEQIKGAAEQSIKRQTRDGGLNDAIGRRR